VQRPLARLDAQAGQPVIGALRRDRAGLDAVAHRQAEHAAEPQQVSFHFPFGIQRIARKSAAPNCASCHAW
jgi:hypothetical protein